MFSNSKFREATWRLDAALIWGSAIAALVVGLIGLVEGLGMALSLLLALAALPLAFVSILLLSNRTHLIAYARSALPGLAGSNATTPPQDDSERLYTSDPEGEATDKQAYNDLLAFSIDRVLPACAAQAQLQEALIDKLCNNKQMAGLAIDGLRSNWRFNTRDFWKHFANLSSGLTESPGPIITLEGMAECIHGLEEGSYIRFCHQCDELAGDFDYRPDPDLYPFWEDWRRAHNQLVRDFEAIKRDTRFGTLLLRPVRPSRWGSMVPPTPNPPSASNQA